MKKIYKILVTCFLFLIACNAAEDLFKEKEAPQVSAIQSDKGFQVDPGDTVTFSVNATNPEEGSLTYKWSAEAETFLGSTQESEATWKAPISGGTYWIEVDVSNDYKTTSKSEEIEVISPDDPFVNITYPNSSEFLIQGTNVSIKFEAIHSNEISEVFVIINDSMIYSRPGHTQNDYEYTWLVSAPAGEAEIRVQALSSTNRIGSDSINVTIEGILPGKSGD